MNRNARLAASVLLGILLMAFLAASVFGSEKGKELPKFHVFKKDVEVGESYEGIDVSYTFTVRNNGKGELQIINVRPG